MNQYTLEDISNHNTENDCWICIYTTVYDITDFLNEHPGGKSLLLQVAGQDATEYFEELHRPEILDEIAEDYKIGNIL